MNQKNGIPVLWKPPTGEAPHYRAHPSHPSLQTRQLRDNAESEEMLMHNAEDVRNSTHRADGMKLKNSTSLFSHDHLATSMI